jgi:hypothetical protein
MSYSNAVVPHLQDVFQADAAHMNYGKYTLFSCFGSTANVNTSPIAFAILFCNKDKAGWEAFWEFTKEQHPCLPLIAFYPIFTSMLSRHTHHKSAKTKSDHMLTTDPTKYLHQYTADEDV